MAFDLTGFFHDQRGLSFRTHRYNSDDDQSLVQASGYFDDVSDPLNTDDILQCFDSTGTKHYTIAVDTIIAGVVTTKGVIRNVAGLVSGSGATFTLKESHSSWTILMDRAAGIDFTLPPAKVGLKYKFFTTVNVTSNDYSISTDSGSEFFIGAVSQIISGSSVSEGNLTNGATSSQISMNGSTNGGLFGSVLEIEGISSTLWAVNGVLTCTGTLISPFI
jgi:hypothetical protein